MTLYRTVYLGVDRNLSPLLGTRTVEAEDIEAANKSIEEEFKAEGFDPFLTICKPDGTDWAMQAWRTEVVFGPSGAGGGIASGLQRAGEEPI